MHKLKPMEIKIALTIMWMQAQKEQWKKVRLSDISKQVGISGSAVSGYCKWLQHCRIVQNSTKEGWTSGDKAEIYLKHWGVI